MRRTVMQRFQAMTAPGDDGCVVWTGCRLPKGYGRFEATLAHRWIYAQTHGVKLGRFDFVLHSCDNPPCVNPAHLRLGTAKENTADMITKGRNRPTGAVGERNTKARLTAQQVMDIRKRYAAGGVTLAALAREFGITDVSTSAIVKGINWKHLPLVAS